jgi:AAA domain
MKLYEIINQVTKGHFGDAFQPEEKKPRTNGDGRDPDGPFAELNTLALRGENLEKWVPYLPIHNLRKIKGRYPSYRGVAQWRMTAPELVGRESNLKITSRGIKDWGDDRGYTPIDLVMAALRIDLKEAFAWLDEKLGWSAGGPELDLEAIRAKETEKENIPDEETSDEPGPDENGRPRPGDLLGSAWYFGDPVPEQPPMLVPFFVPARGFGYLGGQWGTFKTFIVNDLAVAIASGTTFAGQPVSRRGVVIQVELEGSNNEARMLAAAKLRECERERLPIVHFKKEPPKIINGAGVSNGWRQWAKQVAEYGKAIAKHYDLPLVLITIDPQNRVAGFKDEQSSSEGQVVTDAFNYLEHLAECTVLVTDHFGKDATAGLRGTSAKETNPLFILNTSEQQKDVFAKRYLEIRKMRNGQQGIAIDFWMERETVETQQETRDEETGEILLKTIKIDTLAIKWGAGLHPVAAGDKKGDKVKSPTERALATLVTMIKEGGVVLPRACEAPEGLRGILLETWRLRLGDEKVTGGKKPGTAFAGICRKLEKEGDIALGHGFVWVPLPGADWD